MNKNKDLLNVFTYGYVSWRCPLTNIKQFFRNIKYAYQRITKGYCDQDKWNLNTYLSNLLYLSLTDLSEHHCGFPTSYEEINNDDD